MDMRIARSSWVRFHLVGPALSRQALVGTVTRKADHHVVDTGPYAIVRHPIYTGILPARECHRPAKGRCSASWAPLFFTLSFWVKARLEERWLSQELSAEAYDAYSHRVPMLIPFGPRG